MATNNDTLLLHFLEYNKHQFHTGPNVLPNLTQPKMRTIANRALTVLRMAVFMGLVVKPALTQAQPINGEIPDSTVVAFDRFGHPMRLGDMRVPKAPITYLMGGGTNSCTAGWFNLVFTDNGNGFNDPVNGATYRDIACRVFSDLSVLIQPANDPYTLLPPSPGFVNIELRLPWFPAPGAVGFGSAAHGAINFSPTTPLTMMNRTLDGEIWKTINGGYDSWIAQLNGIPTLTAQDALYHGYVYIDFNQFPSTSWHLGPTTPPGAPTLDLYTVIFHEALHGLGVSSFMNSTGNGVNGSNYFSRWDGFLFSGGSPLLNNQWQCNALSYSGAALNNNCGTSFSGSIATEPVHSPNPFNGSSLDHLDGNCPSGFNYLMHPGPIANQSRIPLQAEASVLCDLGYRTTNSIGTDPTWIGTVVNNYTSCGSRLAGVDDVFQYNTTDNYVYTQGQGAPLLLDDFLNNDEDQAKPNTTANEFDPCVEILRGGGTVNILSSTSIDYTPDPGFIGWAVIRYLPINTTTGEHGNYTHIFVLVKQPSGCEPLACDLVVGGDFELITDQYCFPYSNWRISPQNSPDHLWFDGTNWRSPFGLNYSSFCTSGFTPVVPSHNGAPLNQHYVSLVGDGQLTGNIEGVVLELCSPMVPGEDYILEYWARMQTTPCNNVQIDFRAFEQQPCTPAMGATDLTGGAMTCFGTPFAAIPFAGGPFVVAGQWTNYQVAFTFPPGVNGNFVGAYMVVSGGVGDIFLDDVSIHPVIHVTGVVTDACTGQNDGAINLSVHGGSGNYTYLWSNLATTEDLPGLAPGTYSVTVSDELGCSQMETFVVADGGPCVDDFTLTKTVSTTNTYAGAPVLYTITVCNNTNNVESVDLTDTGLYDPLDPLNPWFVATSSTPSWPGFPVDPLTVSIPANDCVTIEIAGHFTTINPPGGPYINCVAATPPAGVDPLTACAEAVEVRQNCPLAVHGTGDCTGNSVSMCMSVHSLITNIETVEFDWIYPDFLTPPDQTTLLTSLSPPPVGSWSFSPASTISAAMTPPAPYDVYDGVTYQMVHVRLVYDSPFTTAGQWRMFCMQFGLTPGDVPAGMNTFRTMVLGSNGDHRTDLYAPGGAEIHPGSGFLTQAANVILTGCPDIPVDEEIAEFTVEVPHCGGLVSVQATNDPPGAIHMWTWGDERTTPINGAASHTYDYFAEITENTEWDFAGTIAAAPPGTYTITHTVILNGVASISTQSVTIYACCQADLVIEDGAMASTVGTNFSGTVAIQGQFNVDVDVTFDNAEVFMEPGSEIILQDGKNLWVTESTIQSCQDVLWKGITTGNGCIVQVRSSMISDAESGVRAMNSSIVLVDESEFKNNRVGIEVPEQGGFNSVAIHSANSSYHAQGPLKLPYPGQTTVVGQKGYAALDLNDMSLNFSGGNNVIHRLSNGIVGNGCDLYVNDCSIQNIQPDAAYVHYANGSGIYARGPKAFRTLKQYGYGQSGAPSFENCHWGIYAEHMNVYSWDNNMVNVGTAYRVDRSGYKDVHIHHNTLDTRRDGIVLHMNDGAAQVLVEDNDITFAQKLPIGQYTKGYYAIRVFEANTLNPNSVIKNNIIHYRPGVTTAYGGIGLVSARKYLVANNALYMSDNASNYVGVLLNGCDDPEVSCNEVYGANNGYPNLGQSGVRNFMGNNAIISCNTVDNTTNGMLFSGWAINTDLKGNEFNNHRWGLHLENGAVIGTQTRTGNLWNQPAPQNGHQAWHENAADAGLHPFWYDPAVPNTLPVSREPLYWFDVDYGTTYSCAPGANYCDQFGERCVGCPKEIYERIADGTLENGDYTDQTRWTMKGDLYDILKEAPELRDDPELEAFYNTVQSTVLAAQKDMNDERIALYDIDASMLGQVVQNREQLLVLQGELKLALEQLAAPDLTAAQRTTLNGVITGLQQTMDGLVTYNTAALELAANTRALSAESVKNTNAAIGATELTETNYKTVHAIYLSTVAKDVEGFTAQQAQDLLAVADQCPLIGGNAVFQARALYYAIDPEQEFDDPTLCLQHGLVTKSLKQPVVNALNMVPNPAMDEVTLVLTSALEEAGTLLICNAQGAEVLRLRVPKDQQRTAVSVATLAPGVYHYRVLGVTGDLGAGKLSIVR